eukprot:TRINITY_DN721_c1_g1_i1.p1 TRINITY_DN721_c1_g1~~TRINITY_DN721_c1_g1_i1.p1  ORF type:complete len:478 (-),score=103.24 TRINITY_DN721_c1_g1_i1:854-2287(-)
MPVLLSLDLGTSKICGIAFDVDNEQVLAVSTHTNTATVEEKLPLFCHEQDAVAIASLCETVVEELLDTLEDRSSVFGFSFSGQMHGVVVVDGNTLNPLSQLITWRDRRISEAEDVPPCLAEAVKVGGRTPNYKTGSHLSPGYGGPTLSYLHSTQPDMFRSGATALSIASFVASRWTNVISMDETHAASWGIFDSCRGDWDFGLCDDLQIPRSVLPPIIPSGESVGMLSLAMCEKWRLSQDIHVFSPVGDNQASVIGSFGFREDAMLVNVGTGAQISIPTATMTSTTSMETRPFPLGGYLLVGASLCGGWSYTYLASFVKSIVGAFVDEAPSMDRVYSVMNQMARDACKEGRSGLTVDGRFMGTRKDPSVLGSVSGISVENLQLSNLAFEFSFSIVQELFDMIESVDISHIRHVYASGTAVHANPVLVGIIEQLFHRPCHVIGMGGHEAALGAAKTALRFLSTCQSEEKQQIASSLSK